MTSERVAIIAGHLRLSPYQTYVLETNMKKYNLSRLVKRGGVLYAPYSADDKHSVKEYIARIFLGPRADLIAPDKMLIIDKRMKIR